MSHRSSDSQTAVALGALKGAAGNAVRDPRGFRFRVVRDTWSAVKRFGSPAIVDVEARALPGVADAVIEGYVDDPNRAVLAAICQAVGAKTFFEFGTNRGRTAWTVARNNVDCQVFTLDLPSSDAVEHAAFGLNASDRDFFVAAWDRGDAFRGTPEEERITSLHGDSATFDYAPYEGRMDVVFVDGAHSYDYVRSDTEQALRMLTDGGTLVWDDYPAIPGVYLAIHEVASRLENPLVHVRGTRLVFCSGSPALALDGDAQPVRQFSA